MERMRQFVCGMLPAVAMLLCIAGSNARAQWSGGFHHGTMAMQPFGQFDGHRYEYQLAGGDTTVDGTALVDAGFPMMGQYQLDVTSDQQADWYLDFGPWWYRPESGAVRPVAGDSITVQGVVFPLDNDLPILVVSRINGREWSVFENGIHWSGGWVHRADQGTRMIYDPTDSLSSVAFMDDFVHMGMMGFAGADSFYCEFTSLPGGFTPGGNQDSLLHLYHFDLVSDQGQNMMTGGFGSRTGMMNFNTALTLRMHYQPHMLDSLGVSPHQMGLYSWNEADSMWTYEPGYFVDTTASMITLTTTAVHSYYAVFSTDIVSGIEDIAEAVPESFGLAQNYPNPFNPETEIRFVLPASGRASLEIFSVTGQRVRTLLDRSLDAGEFHLRWDGTDERHRPVASGVYVYQLRWGRRVESRKMLLLR